MDINKRHSAELASSYLQHVKKCVLCQANWATPALGEVDGQDYVDKLPLLNKIPAFQNLLNTPSFYLKKIKQATIEALGIDYENKVYAMDVDFHEPRISPEQVISKLVHYYAVLLTYFPHRTYEIILATPKVNPATEEAILQALEELQPSLQGKGVTFTYLSGKAFDEQMALLLNATTTECIDLQPVDKELFKERLLTTKRARRTWFYIDGREPEEETWTAERLTQDSDLLNNICTTQKFKDKELLGIYKVKLEITDSIGNQLIRRGQRSLL